MPQQLLTPELVEALIALLVAVLTWASLQVRRYVREAAKSVGDAADVQARESLLRQLDAVLDAGIGAAEEYARNAAKVHLHYSSQAKAEHAVKAALEAAPPELRPYITVAAVEARLPVARARMSLPPPPE